jgi:hypothetical protein
VHAAHQAVIRATSGCARITIVSPEAVYEAVHEGRVPIEPVRELARALGLAPIAVEPAAGAAVPGPAGTPG